MLRIVAKCCLKKLVHVFTVPLWWFYLCLRCVIGRDRAFVEVYEWVAFLPSVCGRYIRESFLRRAARYIGEDIYIGVGTLFSHADLSIGSRVYIGPCCIIGKVVIEDDVLIASHVSIINGGHQHGCDDLSIPMREQPGVYPTVRIGPGAWIGERAIVMADVGRHSIVGAGAVVTKPVPPYAIVAGNPARVLRYRGSASLVAPDNNYLSDASGRRRQKHECA